MDSPRWCERCKTWGDHHTDRHAQVQYSLTQQLSELRLAARHLGLYDAEDWLARQGVEIGQADGSR